jgi:acetyl/propionyl-CoA carboxylase alpha subunit
MSRRTFDVRWNEEALRVELRGDGAVVVDGVPVSVDATHPHAWRVTVGDRTMRLFVARDARGPWVFHDGEVFRPEVADADAQPRARSQVAGALAAPMPATVRAVLVEPGQRVTKGETLVVLEAMKMELALRAPADGIVTTVSCAPGELVQPDVALIAIT